MPILLRSNIRKAVDVDVISQALQHIDFMAHAAQL